jgi:hypothetical protein
LRFAAQSLNGVHEIFVLRHECLAEFHGPGQVVIQHFDHLGHARDGSYVFVPGLLVELRQIVFVRHKSSCLNNLQRVN